MLNSNIAQVVAYRTYMYIKVGENLLNNYITWACMIEGSYDIGTIICRSSAHNRISVYYFQWICDQY